jgi:hypothetical protein
VIIAEKRCYLAGAVYYISWETRQLLPYEAEDYMVASGSASCPAYFSYFSYPYKVPFALTGDYDFAEVKVTDPGNYSQDWWLENWGIPTLHDRAQLLPPPPPPALKRKQLAVKKNDGGGVKKAKAEPRRGRKRRPTDEAAATEEEAETAGGMIKILKVEGGAVEQVVIKQEVMEEETGAMMEDFPSELSRLEMSPFEGTKSYMCAFCPKRYVKTSVHDPDLIRNYLYGSDSGSFPQQAEKP